MANDVTRGTMRSMSRRRRETAGGGGAGPRSLLGRMPEQRWRVVDAALRQRGAAGRGVSGAARRPGRSRCRRRGDGSRKSWGVSELYAVGWRAACRPRPWVGVPVAGRGGSRGARLRGIGWRRPVTGLRHAGCRYPSVVVRSSAASPLSRASPSRAAVHRPVVTRSVSRARLSSPSRSASARRACSTSVVASILIFANSASTASSSRRRRSPSARRPGENLAPVTCILRLALLGLLLGEVPAATCDFPLFTGYRVLQLLAESLAFSHLGLEPGDALVDGRFVAGLFAKAPGQPGVVRHRPSRRRRGVRARRGSRRAPVPARPGVRGLTRSRGGHRRAPAGLPTPGASRNPCGRRQVSPRRSSRPRRLRLRAGGRVRRRSTRPGPRRNRCTRGERQCARYLGASSAARATTLPIPQNMAS